MAAPERKQPASEAGSASTQRVGYRFAPFEHKTTARLLRALGPTAAALCHLVGEEVLTLGNPEFWEPETQADRCQKCKTFTFTAIGEGERLEDATDDWCPKCERQVKTESVELRGIEALAYLLSVTPRQVTDLIRAASSCIEDAEDPAERQGVLRVRRDGGKILLGWARSPGRRGYTEVLDKLRPIRKCKHWRPEAERQQAKKEAALAVRIELACPSCGDKHAELRCPKCGPQRPTGAFIEEDKAGTVVRLRPSCGERTASASASGTVVSNQQDTAEDQKYSSGPTGSRSSENLQVHLVSRFVSNQQHTAEDRNCISGSPPLASPNAKPVLELLDRWCGRFGRDPNGDLPEILAALEGTTPGSALAEDLIRDFAAALGRKVTVGKITTFLGVISLGKQHRKAWELRRQRNGGESPPADERTGEQILAEVRERRRRERGGP